MIESSKKPGLLRSSLLLAPLLLLLVGQSLHAEEHSITEHAEQCVACALQHGGAAPTPKDSATSVDYDVSCFDITSPSQVNTDAPAQLRPETRAPPSFL